ncbi:PaaI family thioesterase [Marinibaculum pumilum]|uniref:PaaI family thioesterase n=1 Tax=Marinibaculum pumilum TaxID=1766165 RepID=A0ABV7KWE6_9PROT
MTQDAETGADPDLLGMPMPPCARLLGWRLIEQDPDAGRIRVGFEGRPEFCNPAGLIQGGLLAAMLDDTMGPALVVASRGRLYCTTIDMNVSYLAPVRPGPLEGRARVVEAGRTIAFLEGELVDAEGRVLLRATSSARVLEAARALGGGAPAVQPGPD